MAAGCLLADQGFAQVKENAQRNNNAIQTIYRSGVPHTDNRGRLLTEYEAGKSFFQIALWGPPLPHKHERYEVDWTVFKEAGFNTVWPWNTKAEPSLKAAEEAGLQAVIMEAIPAETLKEVADHPHLFGNVWADEPIGHYGAAGFDMDAYFQSFVNYRKSAKELAPDLPVFVNDAPWIMAPATSWWTRWNQAGDVTCHDNYPVMNKGGRRARSIGSEPNGIPQSVSMAVSINQEAKPAWLIVGAFEQPSGSSAPFPFRFPSVQQLRSQVYAGIIHGVTGIIYFAYDSYITRDAALTAMSPNPLVTYLAMTPEQAAAKPGAVATPSQLIQSRALWEAAVQINRELNELTPVIFAPTVGHEVDYKLKVTGESVTETPIRCLLKPHPEGGYVLLTVNLDDAMLDVEYQFPSGLQEVAKLFDNSVPKNLNGENTFDVHYEPFETHIIRIIPTAGASSLTLPKRKSEVSGGGKAETKSEGGRFYYND